MMPSHGHPPVRVDELLADRALFGLDRESDRELQRLLDEFDSIDVEALDRTAASCALAGLAIEPMPIELRQRIVRDAARHVPSALPRANEPRRVLVLWSGWLAAAAILLCFLLRGPETVRIVDADAIGWDRLTPGVYVQRLESNANDLRSFEWSGGEFADAGASGRIVWSQSLQRGYIQVHRAQANDRSREQFQLWIFTDEQKHPVDGGVFDIPRREGDVIIPIAARLHVDHPNLFAVTVERPGGVVVSDKERIVLVANTGN
ncbi:MAG: anti-sigma factor [Planctomycetes bacterium]|nr:anti-sigma factor [Planctomycetota bacterium]